MVNIPILIFLIMKKIKQFVVNPNLYDKITPATAVDSCCGPKEYLASVNLKSEQLQKLTSQKKIGLNIKIETEV